MEKITIFLKEKSTSFPFKFLIGKPVLFLPISIILTIIPLIVHARGIVLDEDTTPLYGNSVQTDLFSQWKAKFLIYFSIILIIISILFFKKIFHKKDKIINMILVGIFVFWVFALISTIFSKYHYYAIWGAFDRAEGIVTITCYMILLLYSIYTFKSTDDYRYICIPLLILLVIESIIGIFQYTGHDLLSTHIGSLLATGYWNSDFSLSNPVGKLYGTLYHYDYVGSFAAIVLPLLFILTIFEKKRSFKIILGIGSLLGLWLLLGSTSRAGLVGVFFSFVFAAILLTKYLLKHWKFILMGFVCIFALVIGLNFVTKGSVLERVPSLLADAGSIFKSSNSNTDDLKSIPITDIEYVDGHSEVTLQDETIKIYFENKNYIFRNSKNETINYTEDNRVFTTTDPSFSNISFSYVKNSGRKAGFIYLSLNNQNIFGFSLGKDNTVHLIDPNTSQDIDIAHPEITSFFIGKEKLGSARGYIWSRSIPLVKNNLIIGSGPDTFPFQFPQNDYIGKYYAYDTPNMLVDKPHNLYLQFALNYGLVSLIGFLCIIFIYIIDCIRLYAFKNHYDHSKVVGIATFVGIIGYLFSGFFNDSLISVAPVFWIVLGVGISVNFINRKAL